jgi:hypothetical protein
MKYQNSFYFLNLIWMKSQNLFYFLYLIWIKSQNPFYFLYTMTLLKILSELKKYRINLISFHDKLLNNQIEQYIYIIIGVKCSKFEISLMLQKQ